MEAKITISRAIVEDGLPQGRDVVHCDDFHAERIIKQGGNIKNQEQTSATQSEANQTSIKATNTGIQATSNKHFCF